MSRDLSLDKFKTGVYPVGAYLVRLSAKSGKHILDVKATESGEVRHVPVEKAAVRYLPPNTPPNICSCGIESVLSFR